MSSVEKVSNVLVDRKEELVTTPSSTKDIDKGTDEFEDIKKAVVTIRRKGLEKF